jgi:ABC-type microcin C transport system duplicated ATPase subunit YejF
LLRFVHRAAFSAGDLAVVRRMSDDIALLKDGLLVETGESEASFVGPMAAYSRDRLIQPPPMRFGAAG